MREGHLIFSPTEWDFWQKYIDATDDDLAEAKTQPVSRELGEAIAAACKLPHHSDACICETARKLPDLAARELAECKAERDAAVKAKEQAELETRAATANAKKWEQACKYAEAREYRVTSMLREWFDWAENERAKNTKGYSSCGEDCGCLYSHTARLLGAPTFERIQS